MSDQQTIHERMATILAELPAIGKDTRNEQQNFMFRSHDHVLNALNPLLAKHRVFVVPNVLDRVVAQRQTARGSVMFEVNLHVGYRFYGPLGDYVEASAWGEGTDMGDKATNKAMTMAFKNVLNQAFAISTAETIDSDSLTPDESVKASQVSARNTGRSPAAPTEAAAPSSHGSDSGAAAPTPGVIGDGNGFAASRADAPTDGGDPAKVLISFGKHAKDGPVPLGDLPRSYLEWLWDKYEPRTTDQKRVKAAAGILIGAGGPAPAALDEDIPF